MDAVKRPENWDTRFSARMTRNRGAYQFERLDRVAALVHEGTKEKDGEVVRRGCKGTEDKGQDLGERVESAQGREGEGIQHRRGRVYRDRVLGQSLP